VSVRSALVVGGGIGGVTAAIALRRIGWDVTVLERAASISDVGSGITLFPNALRSLDVLAAGDAVRAVGAPPPAAGLQKPDGRVVVDVSAVPSVGGIYAFHRADLHRVLRSFLPDGVLRPGTDVTDAGPAGGADGAGARVTLADGSTLTADLVVAADGLRSTVRAALWPDHPGPRYAGYTSWRAVTAEPVAGIEYGGETWGRGERFGTLPLRDGRVYWFATANVPAGESGAPHEEVRRRFGGWHDPIPRLLAATPPDDVLRLDIHDLHLPLPPFARGRVALLGDAAHAMTPDVGQGACQAIEDAVTLAAALGGEPDVPRALSVYDDQRRPRTRSIVKAAKRAGRLAQAEGAVAVAVRDLMMRVVPPSASLRMVERITAWTPPPLP
jgi:2-polyprenyl-6-methoxyphenol hydroxylase-like FAD-dependent oxidoreductase